MILCVISCFYCYFLLVLGTRSYLIINFFSNWYFHCSWWCFVVHSPNVKHLCCVWNHDLRLFCFHFVCSIYVGSFRRRLACWTKNYNIINFAHHLFIIHLFDPSYFLNEAYLTLSYFLWYWHLDHFLHHNSKQIECSNHLHHQIHQVLGSLQLHFHHILNLNYLLLFIHLWWLWDI